MKPKASFCIWLSLLSCLILNAFSSTTLAATYVSGEITQSTTWTVAGSPYIG